MGDSVLTGPPLFYLSYRFPYGDRGRGAKWNACGIISEQARSVAPVSVSEPALPNWT